MSFIDPNDFLSAESGKDSLDSGQDSPQDSNLQQGGYLDNTNLTDSQPQDANPAISDPIKETYSMDNLGTNPYVPVDYLHGADETKDDGMDLIDRGIAYHAQELLNDPDRSSGLLIGVLKDQANLMGNPYVQNLLDRHEAIGHFNGLGEANPWKDYLVQTPDAMTLGHGMPGGYDIANAIAQSTPDNLAAAPALSPVSTQDGVKTPDTQAGYLGQDSVLGGAGIDLTNRYTPITNSTVNFISNREQGQNAPAALKIYYDDGTSDGSKGGKPTIGYGHLIKNEQELLEYSQGITQQQAEELRKQDIQEAANKVSKAVEVPLTQPQFDALTSYVYNVGHLGPNLTDKINRGDYEGAATEMNVNTQNHHYLGGLESRRQSERNLFRFGDYGN